jgi:DNA-binding MarR family transcriptional regulator
MGPMTLRLMARQSAARRLPRKLFAKHRKAGPFRAGCAHEKITGKLTSLNLQVFLLIYTLWGMNDTLDASLSPETAVTELSLAIGQLVRRLRAEANPGELSWSQIATLARLEKAGAMTTADLARSEHVKPQSMGTTLSDLEQEGLVQRRPHPTDGRQVLFELTAAGIEARRQRHTAKREWLLAAVDRLDQAEQQTLVAAAALIKRLAET